MKLLDNQLYMYPGAGSQEICQKEAGPINMKKLYVEWGTKKQHYANKGKGYFLFLTKSLKENITGA